MRLINASFEIIEQEPGEVGMLKHIEKAKRVCYKSEHNITEDSYIRAVQDLIDLKHGAMLEHGTVWIKHTNDFVSFPIDILSNEFTYDCGLEIPERMSKYIYQTYVHKTINDENPRGTVYVLTNYRVFVENKFFKDWEIEEDPPIKEDLRNKRVTVKFTCDRGVSHEFVRHRVFSFAQESTRYCNYSKNKFGNDCTFIIPCWFETLKYDNTPEESLQRRNNIDFNRWYAVDNKENDWVISMLDAELTYKALTADGWTPQQARSVLPNSLKTELIMTGTIEQWKGFFELRNTKAAHPQAFELANPLYKEFINRGYLK